MNECQKYFFKNINTIFLKIFKNERISFDEIKTSFNTYMLECPKMIKEKDIYEKVISANNINEAIKLIKSLNEYSVSISTYETIKKSTSHINFFNRNKVFLENKSLNDAVKKINSEKKQFLNDDSLKKIMKIPYIPNPAHETNNLLSQMLEEQQEQKEINQKQKKVNNFNNIKSNILFLITIITALSNPNIFKFFKNIFIFFIKLLK